MLWFKGRYVQYLEQENSSLKQQLAAQKVYSDQLIERLLMRAGVPSVELPPEPSAAALDSMLQAGAGGIFDDVDEAKEDDKVDNRHEKYDSILD
jgi:hypothetical protein